VIYLQRGAFSGRSVPCILRGMRMRAGHGFTNVGTPIPISFWRPRAFGILSAVPVLKTSKSHQKSSKMEGPRGGHATRASELMKHRLSPEHDRCTRQKGGATEEPQKEVAPPLPRSSIPPATLVPWVPSKAARELLHLGETLNTSTEPVFDASHDGRSQGLHPHCFVHEKNADRRSFGQGAMARVRGEVPIGDEAFFLSLEGLASIPDSPALKMGMMGRLRSVLNNFSGE